MLAYHNDPQLKQQILQQLQRHYDADEIVKGQYWQDGKGCAVGCTLHTDQHKEYETRFGIPVRLAHLEDIIFERLPNNLAKNWPIRFMSAIQVGADLSTIWRDFVIWLLIDPVDGVIQYTTPGTEVYHAIMQVAQLYQDGHTQQQMRDAGFAAASAASESYIAGANAAGYIAANIAHVAGAGAEYVYAAAHATRNAVRNYSAYAGAHATRYNENDDIYKHARNVAYIKISNKLIELLQKQEVTHDHK